MNNECIFSFREDISAIEISDSLNNPFGDQVPCIARIAAREFQEYLIEESKHWTYNFQVEKGKMFGVLVVEDKDNSLQYLGAVSGKLLGDVKLKKLVPSVFKVSTGDYFINKGMTELTMIGSEIKNEKDATKVAQLIESRRTKSIALQTRLFQNYHFTNLSGIKMNLIDIFQKSVDRFPASAAGECAAPKLFQYAHEHKLKPIALAEFWWGNSKTRRDRLHQTFYPSCKDKCRPILEFIVEDESLFSEREERKFL